MKRKRDYSCGVCNLTFASKSLYTNHDKQVHSEQRHQCKQCTKSFKHKKDLNRHVSTKHALLQSFDVHKVKYNPWSHIREAFREWCKQTGRATERSQTLQILATCKTFYEQYELPFSHEWDDLSSSQTLVDEWYIHEHSRGYNDCAAELRHLSVFLQFVSCQQSDDTTADQKKEEKDTEDDEDHEGRDHRESGGRGGGGGVLKQLVEWIQRKLSDANHENTLPTPLRTSHSSGQDLSRATVWNNCAGTISSLDPRCLVDMRNHVVSELNKMQVKYDVYIRNFLKDSHPGNDDDAQKNLEFGLELRCWLDLAIRFTNVAHRTQATREMVVPNSSLTKYVCKLLYKKGLYYRLWYCDKVGTSGNQRPVECSLGTTVSAYMFFYLTYCRPRSSNSSKKEEGAGEQPFVFLEKSGTKWVHLARDVKAYCRTSLNIDPDEVDPSGRFTHFVRHICLASYATACDFNLDKLQRFATLMRHSVAVMNKYYITWNKWYLSQVSANEYLTQVRVVSRLQAPKSRAMLEPLAPPPSELMEHMNETLNLRQAQLTADCVYGVADVATQTP